MRIALMTPSLNEYSETFIQAHKKYLQGTVFHYYGGNNFQLEGSKKLISSSQEWYLKVARRINKKVPDFDRNFKLRQSFKKNNIQAVLVEYGTLAYRLQSFLKSLEIPITVHFHGYDASVNEVIEKCNNYKEVFKIANKIVVVSRIMEKTLLDLGCPPNKLVYNVYGPQPEFEEVQPTFQKKQFISIGRFTNKKAPYYTILAFRQVLEKHPDAQLIMAGTGELLNSCKNLVNYFGLQNHIHFVGVITPQQFREYLSESIAYVQHSITAENGDQEGTPLAVLEASCAGLPVISTYHAGIPDVIIHNRTGLLCDEHQIDKMASNMQRLLDNPNEAIWMGQEGKKNIRENYSLHRHIDVLQSTLDL